MIILSDTEKHLCKSLKLMLTLISAIFLFLILIYQITMEKRRNTLDRWQKLRFGRRSASNPPEDKKLPQTSDSSSAETNAKRSSDKTERLRELTELLKSRPSSSTSATPAPAPPPPPPPIPPPRKPRSSITSTGTNSSIEKYIDASASESGSPISIEKKEHKRNDSGSSTGGNSIFHIPLIEKLRPNSSISNLEAMLSKNKTDINSKSKDKLLPQAEENSLFKSSTKPTAVLDTSTTSLPRAESRTIVGSYMQKTIPFRSASFSQVDYSSGKYIRSALGALKSTLSRNQNPAIVGNTNLTLPRKKDGSRSSSPSFLDTTEIIVIPPSDVEDNDSEIGSTKSDASEKIRTAPRVSDLNLNLTRRYPQPSSSSATIIEEDNENSPTADTKEMTYTTPSKEATAKTDDSPQFKVVQASEMIIDSLPEEEVALHASNAPYRNEDYLQTATTCLIPVPVYECAVRDWVETHLADQWINACEIDSAKIVEEVNVEAHNITEKCKATETELPELSVLQSTIETNKHASDDIPKMDENSQSKEPTKVEDEQAENKPNRTSAMLKASQSIDLDDVPAIAVTPGSSISGSSFEEAANPDDSRKKEKSDDYKVEVRKRHSNGSKSDNRNSDNTTSTSGSSSPKSNADTEKRRIDKSKRRKGVYIQWAELDKRNKEMTTIPWDESLRGDGDSDRPIWPLPVEAHGENGGTKQGASSLESESDLDIFAAISSTVAQKLEKGDAQNDKKSWLSCVTPDEIQTPGSQGGSLPPSTPDSEYGRPIWPTPKRAQLRRQSLSLQSSEEKDDSPVTSSPSSRPHHKLFVLRSDSISDNESSDRTPPSRDRASPSPAPGDQDLKRYSKRPLRGPYGQMLEAEMKKPAKLNYDGLLQELNRSER